MKLDIGMILAAAIVGGGAIAGLIADRPRSLSGTASVVDGDTLDVQGVRIRLWGIDAPEWNTPAGAVAKNTMRQLLAHGPVICEAAQDMTSHGRIVARCTQSGVDLGRRLLQLGVALDCPAYSHGAYAGDEADGARNMIKPAPYCEG